MTFPERVHGQRSAPRGGLGYEVVPGSHGIKALACQFCQHYERLHDYRLGRDRSGLPKYNRARAAMIRHLYKDHAAEIRAALALDDAKRRS